MEWHWIDFNLQCAAFVYQKPIWPFLCPRVENNTYFHSPRPFVIHASAPKLVLYMYGSSPTCDLPHRFCISYYPLVVIYWTHRMNPLCYSYELSVQTFTVCPCKLFEKRKASLSLLLFLEGQRISLWFKIFYFHFHGHIHALLSSEFFANFHLLHIINYSQR